MAKVLTGTAVRNDTPQSSACVGFAIGRVMPTQVRAAAFHVYAVLKKETFECHSTSPTRPTLRGGRSPSGGSAACKRECAMVSTTLTAPTSRRQHDDARIIVGAVVPVRVIFLHYQAAVGSEAPRLKAPFGTMVNLGKYGTVRRRNRLSGFGYVWRQAVSETVALI